MLIDILEKDPILAIDDDGEKIHPWRICPIGKHYVKNSL